MNSGLATVAAAAVFVLIGVYAFYKAGLFAG